MEYINTIPTKNIPIDLFLNLELSEKADVTITLYDIDMPNIVILTRIIKNVKRIMDYHIPLPLTPLHHLGIKININKGKLIRFNAKREVVKRKDFFINKNEKETINALLYVAYYLPYMKYGDIVLKNGVVIRILKNINNNTPAQVNRQHGIFRLDKKRMLEYNVNMRVFILLHEFCHFFVPSPNEPCADNCALKYYNDLGFSQKESLYLMRKLYELIPKERTEKYIKSLISYNIGEYVNYCRSVIEDLPKHKARF